MEEKMDNKIVVFLNEDNDVIESLAFAIDESEEFINNSMIQHNAVKFIDCGNKKYCGIGNKWNEEHQKFVPPTNWEGLAYDFDREAWFPETPKPETEDITKYDWDWDYPSATWVKKYPEDTPGPFFE